jgi:hypothetical protein
VGILEDFKHKLASHNVPLSSGDEIDVCATSRRFASIRLCDASIISGCNRHWLTAVSVKCSSDYGRISPISFPSDSAQIALDMNR